MPRFPLALLLAIVLAISTHAVETTSKNNLAKERGLAAILGAFVGDAASMPLHWIYNTSEVAALVGKGNPEFYPTPSCPYYNYSLGSFSPYGQQTDVYLTQLSQTGEVATDLEHAYLSFYSKGGSCYTATPLNASKCYKDGSTKGFLANEQAGLSYPKCGANDTQANAIVHMIPIVAKYAGEADLMDKVETIIRVTQNTDQAVAFGRATARVLEAVILGRSGVDAVKSSIQAMQKTGDALDADLAQRMSKVLTQLHQSNFDVVQEVGQSCDYPNNLVSGSHLIAQAPGYVSGIRQRIMAGGDCASANAWNGAVFAALAGLEDGIPLEWKRHTNSYDRVMQAAQQWLDSA